MYTKEQMIDFIKWYDDKKEEDCHRTFLEEFNEWNDRKLLEQMDNYDLMTSEERHQISMFDKIEKALSERPFENKELDLILKVLKNSKSYVIVLGA